MNKIKHHLNLLNSNKTKILKMINQEIAELKNFANHLTDLSEPIAKKYFRTPNGEVEKDDKSPVTLADREIEEILRAEIIKQFPDIQISNSRKIIDLRNRIIHGYDTIADEVIWGIIINHIPILKKEIESILES